MDTNITATVPRAPTHTLFLSHLSILSPLELILISLDFYPLILLILFHFILRKFSQRYTDLLCLDYLLLLSLVLLAQSSSLFCL